MIRLIMASMKKGTPPTRTRPRGAAQQALHHFGRATAFGQDAAAVCGQLDAKRGGLQGPAVVNEQGLAHPGL